MIDLQRGERELEDVIDEICRYAPAAYPRLTLPEIRRLLEAIGVSNNETYKSLYDTILSGLRVGKQSSEYLASDVFYGIISASGVCVVERGPGLEVRVGG